MQMENRETQQTAAQYATLSINGVGPSFSGNTSPRISNIPALTGEFNPNVIMYSPSNESQIDAITNFYGTSCMFFTNSLKGDLQVSIVNRKNHACVVTGDFKGTTVYDIEGRILEATFRSRIMFIQPSLFIPPSS